MLSHSSHPIYSRQYLQKYIVSEEPSVFYSEEDTNSVEGNEVKLENDMMEEVKFQDMGDLERKIFDENTIEHDVDMENKRKHYIKEEEYELPADEDEDESNSGGDQDDNYEQEEQSAQNKVKQSKSSRRILNRKVRTTITKEKLDAMNHIFKQYQAARSSSTSCPALNLRQISQKLGLGYSTILHKFKQFKDNKEVKGGYLLELGDQKRKYKKSLLVEQHITAALQAGQMVNAVEISKWIYRNKKVYYSRAVVCRHLRAMNKQEQKTKSVEGQQRPKLTFQRAIQSQIEKGNVIFCNETVFSTKAISSNLASCDQVVSFNKRKTGDCFCISTFVAVHQGKLLHFKVKRGLISRAEYVHQLEAIGKQIRKIDQNGRKILAVNLNQLHYDSFTQGNSSEADPLIMVMDQYNLSRVVLPVQYMPVNIFSLLHTSIRDTLNREVLNRQHMKKLVEQEVRVWSGNIQQ